MGRYEVRWTSGNVENVYNTNDLNEAYAKYLEIESIENIADLGLYDLERSLTLVVEY